MFHIFLFCQNSRNKISVSLGFQREILNIFSGINQCFHLNIFFSLNFVHVTCYSSQTDPHVLVYFLCVYDYGMNL
jgi:hypothetical protein